MDTVFIPSRVRAIYKNVEKYIDTLNSIKAKGMRSPVGIIQLTADTVLPDLKGNETQLTAGQYVLEYGNNRWEIAKDLEWTEIPAVITEKDIPSIGVLREYQLAENIQRQEMKKIEVAKSIKEWLESGSTLADVSKMLNKPEHYVLSMLSMNTLPDDIKAMVTAGKINATNAMKLSNALKRYPEKHDEIISKAKKGTVDFQKYLDQCKTEKALEKKSANFWADVEFSFNENLDTARLDLKWNELKSAHENAQYDDSKLSEYEQGMYDILAYIHTVSEEDIAEQREAFEEKRNKALERIEKSEAKKAERKDKE